MACAANMDSTAGSLRRSREGDHGIAQWAKVLLQRQAADLGVQAQRGGELAGGRIEHDILDALRRNLPGEVGQPIESWSH